MVTPCRSAMRGRNDVGRGDDHPCDTGHRCYDADSGAAGSGLIAGSFCTAAWNSDPSTGNFRARGELSMANEPHIAILDTGAVGAYPDCATRRQESIGDYWALTKPEVNFLILIATFAGFYLARTPGRTLPPAGFQTLRMICTLVGTLLVASGTAALNQFLERSFDAQMRRTARRPVASGRVAPCHALWFGIAVSLAGALFLAITVNALTSLLSVATFARYLFGHPPLKRKTPLWSFPGAFPGAVPPLIGWAAARGRLDWEAWILCARVFLCQYPHFIAIAWMYREDCARAACRVLPAGRWRGRAVTWQSAAVW